MKGFQSNRNAQTTLGLESAYQEAIQKWPHFEVVLTTESMGKKGTIEEMAT